MSLQLRQFLSAIKSDKTYFMYIYMRLLTVNFHKIFLFQVETFINST